MVPESAGQMAEARQYKEGTGQTRPQRPSTDLQRRTHPAGGD